MRGKMFRRVGRPDAVKSFASRWVSEVPQVPQISISQIVLPDSDYGPIVSLFIEFTRPDGKVIVNNPLSLPVSQTSQGLETFTALDPALNTPSGIWGVRLAAAIDGGPVGVWSEKSAVTVGN